MLRCAPAAASAYIDLIVRESDNNVKLIVLDRVESLRARHDRGTLADLAMDLLRVLSSPDLQVKSKALAIALELVSPRNVEDVVLLLKKELVKTLDAGNAGDKAIEVRTLLIQSIHSCAIKFSEVASSVVLVLLDFLGDSNNAAAVDVIAFVREVVEKFPELRQGIVDRLRGAMGEIKSGKVFRGALWIVGEYAADVDGASP
jgi:coatomer subunit beta